MCERDGLKMRDGLDLCKRQTASSGKGGNGTNEICMYIIIIKIKIREKRIGTNNWGKMGDHKQDPVNPLCDKERGLNHSHCWIEFCLLLFFFRILFIFSFFLSTYFVKLCLFHFDWNWIGTQNTIVQHTLGVNISIGYWWYF